MMCSKVLLPEPEGPTMANDWPSQLRARFSLSTVSGLSPSGDSKCLVILTNWSRGAAEAYRKRLFRRHRKSSVRNGEAGRPAWFHIFTTGKSAQPYLTAIGCETNRLLTTTLSAWISALAQTKCLSAPQSRTQSISAVRFPGRTWNARSSISPRPASPHALKDRAASIQGFLHKLSPALPRSRPRLVPFSSNECHLSRNICNHRHSHFRQDFGRSNCASRSSAQSLSTGFSVIASIVVSCFVIRRSGRPEK